MIKKITLLTLIIAISSCTAQEYLKEYYYPTGTNEDAKVYKYVDKNNQNNIEYWKVTTKSNDKILLTESFTADFRLYNIFEERHTENGAELISYADFEQNEEGRNIRIDGTVEDKDVYKWMDNNKYKYSVKYNNPEYGNEQFIKERTKNRFENITIQGTEYPTAKFLDEYEIRSLENGQNYKFYQFTYYAKDIGMVKYQRYHPDGTTIELQLDGILSEKEFEQLRGKASR